MPFVFLCAALLALYVLASVIFAVLGVYYGFLRTTHTEYFSNTGVSARHPFRNRIESEASMLYNMPHEDRFLTAFDGLRLHAALYRTADAKGLVVCVHGFHSRADKDFASLFGFYREHGCHVLLVDQRAHMQSEGKFATYGVCERFDLRDWIADMSALFGRSFPIWLHGESMGAATCMMISDLPLAGNVRGIIDDSGFDSPISEMKYIFRTRFHFPPYPGVWFIALFCRLFIRASVYDASAVKSLSKTTIPCLFIHGDADDVVPVSSAQNVFEACASEKELWSIPGAGHCAAFYIDEDEYKSRLSAFLGRTYPDLEKDRSV